jgi:hypothetical protein
MLHHLARTLRCPADASAIIEMSIRIVFASKAIFIGDDISARLGAKDAFNR